MTQTTPLTHGAMQGSQINGAFAVDGTTTTGLTFGYKAVDYVYQGIEINVSAGTTLLVDDTVNDVLMDRQTGVVSVGSGNSGNMTLYRVTTASGNITSIVDTRAAYV